eukprot:757894-Hanusia_phi.AAC.1
MASPMLTRRACSGQSLIVKEPPRRPPGMGARRRRLMAILSFIRFVLDGSDLVEQGWALRPLAGAAPTVRPAMGYTPQGRELSAQHNLLSGDDLDQTAVRDISVTGATFYAQITRMHIVGVKPRPATQRLCNDKIRSNVLS